MDYKRPESVLVLVTCADEVLLLRRRDPPEYWQSVTGSLEWGESAFAAAKRELREEAGLAADAGLEETGIFNEFEIIPPWTAKFAPGVNRNREWVYLLRLDQRPEIELDSAEHVEYAWLGVDEALEKASSSSNRAAIRRLLKH